MGYLIIAQNYTKNPEGEYEINKKYRYRSGFKNKAAVENLIRYITRTRLNEDRRYQLITYGGLGVGLSLAIEDMIKFFRYVQDNCRSRNDGPKMFHEIFRLDSSQQGLLQDKPEMLELLALRCAKIYFDAGFQVIYALHY